MITSFTASPPTAPSRAPADRPTPGPASPTRRTPNYCNDGSPDGRLHLHPERRRHRHGVGDGRLRGRRACRPRTTARRSQRTLTRPPSGARKRHRRRWRSEDDQLGGHDSRTHGTVTITGGGAGLTYKPNANYCNTAERRRRHLHLHAERRLVRHRVDDGRLRRRSAGAVDDSAHVTEDDPATAIDVLGNDTDVEGDPITVTVSRRQPGHGTVVMHRRWHRPHLPAGRQLLQHPVQRGPRQLHLHDQRRQQRDTVSVTVDCVDDPPVAVDDSSDRLRRLRRDRRFRCSPTTPTSTAAPKTITLSQRPGPRDRGDHGRRHGPDLQAGRRLLHARRRPRTTSPTP